MTTIKMTPLGVNPPDCYCCGEWLGASTALTDSVLRHSICFNLLVTIQEELTKENPDIQMMLELTIKTIGDKRYESRETS
jgi:hypothetical protein